MKRVICGKCKTAVMITGPGDYTCTGCGAHFKVAARKKPDGSVAPKVDTGAELTPVAERPEITEVPPDAIKLLPPEEESFKPPASKPGTRRTTGKQRRVATRSGLPPVKQGQALIQEVALSAFGAVALLVAGIVFLASPFDGGLKSKLLAKEKDLSDEVAGGEKKLAGLEKHVEELTARIPAEKKREKDLRKDAARLRAVHVQLRLLDGKLKRLTLADGEAEGLADATPAGATADDVSIAEKAIVIIKTDIGFGSGFVIDAEGTVVTNYHVLEATSKLTLKMQKRDSTEQVEIEGATIVAVDADKDLALIEMPPPPEEVAVNGGYRTITLRKKPEVTTGETVYALGSPGAGKEILDYTLTKGIVSNPHREGEEIHYIQTTAPVNPGNSGGPLLDDDGRAVGVVAWKFMVEAVAFAIPAEFVNGLVENRERTPYAVNGPLEDWEKENRPLTALARRRPSYRDDRAFDLEHHAHEILLSTDGRKLYLLSAREGKVMEFNISAKKVSRTFSADTAVGAMALDRRGSMLYLAASEKKALLSVKTGTMELDREASLPMPPSDVSFVGGTGGMISVAMPRESPVLMTYYDLGRTTEPTEFEEDRYSVVSACNGRWLCLARQAPPEPGRPSTPFELIAYQTKDLQLFKTLDRTRADAKRRGFPPNLVRRVSKLQKQVDSSRCVYAISESIAYGEGGLAPEILFAGDDKIIFGRRIIKPGKTMKVVGTFEPGPYSTDDRDAMKRRREYYLYMDNIFSTSASGRWAATGTHIYSVISKKAIKQLPFPSTVHAFSHDGTTLYMYDGLRRKLYILDDWEKNADDI